MYIEMDSKEFHYIFGEQSKAQEMRAIVLNGVAFVIKGYDYWSECSMYQYRVGYKFYIEPLVKPKSPQEVAAEEAVQKAESALKAAKEVLKTVKEK